MCLSAAMPRRPWVSRRRAGPRPTAVASPAGPTKNLETIPAMKIILGSSSASRQKILRELGIEFEIIKPDIDEKAIRRETPEELVLAIAEAKMDAVLSKVDEPAIVITSDQVISVNGTVFEKPVSIEEARTMLRAYRTNPPAAPVAVVVANTATGQRLSAVDVPVSYFSEIPETLIEELSNDPTIVSYAGALCIEDPRVKPFVSRLDGDLDSFEGMPKRLLLDLLNRVGYEA